MAAARCSGDGIPDRKATAPPCALPAPPARARGAGARNRGRRAASGRGSMRGVGFEPETGGMRSLDDSDRDAYH